MENEKVDKLGKIIWNYLRMDKPLQPADCAIGLGSHDLRVAERTAEIFLEGWVPLIIFTGGSGRLTPVEWKKPEAEMFADVAIKMGVPKGKILIENKSTNTGENIRFTQELMAEKNIKVRKIIIVQKPYMTRRAYAAFMKQWPEIDVIPTSPQISYENYPNKDISQEEVISIMLGDLERIKEYPAQGFQIPQEIPRNVWNAYNTLVKLGFAKSVT